MVKLVGTDKDDLQFGGGRDDVLIGNGDVDRMHGGGGNDQMDGGAGNDVMFGESGRGGVADMTRMRIFEDVKGSATFMGESAGYMNALGMYKIAADGTIYDVKMLWSNASEVGSGGNLVAGKSAVDFGLAAGDRVGFFVVPNGFSNSEKVLSSQKGTWQFVDAKGQPGNINGGVELKLVLVDAKGRTTDVKSEYGTSVFHSVDDGSLGLNGDKLNHVHAEVDVATGTLRIGFEDLKNGGDRDYDDSVFLVNIGQTNAALLPKVSTGESSSSHDDVMHGGEGHDQLIGMAGNDRMDGGDGNDRMWGNSGDDVMHGGAGDDELYGGKGNDTLSDGEGDDHVDGNSGDDHVVAGEGNDVYDGGSGFDTVDFSNATRGMMVNLNQHVAEGMGKDQLDSIEGVVGSKFDDNITGNKEANVLNGGDGNDVIRGLGGADTLTGGDGHDTFVWLAKDVIDAKGNHLGVDVVTDFGKEDTLDFRKLLQDQKYESIDDVVAVKSDGVNSHVYAQLQGNWVEVVVLNDFHASSASELLKSGMLLA